MRARIEALRGELEEKVSDRREARDALRASEAAISDANRDLAHKEQEARAAREGIEHLAAQKAALERLLDSRQAVLGRLLASQHASGAPDALRLALSGQDPADTARKLHYLRYVSRAAAEIIGAHRSNLAELARLRQEFEAAARGLADIEAASRAHRERLLAERRERRGVLERTAVEVRKARKEIRVLVADESRLARLVEEIGKFLSTRPGAGHSRVEQIPEAGAETGPFSTLKGLLRLPVRGELAGRFGTPRTEGASAAKGVFIRAGEGEPVRAVAAGRVVYADWMRGFGNLLILDHGEAYLSIYGNNESLLKRTGDTVGAGETLATVGASGGNVETGLYFELRHLGKTFDPLGWVRLK